MEIDWNASKKAWITEMRSVVLPKLRDPRFLDAEKLIARFEAAVVRWLADDNMPPLINDGNELCAAAALLGTMHADDRLLYEPRLAATKKSLDFRVDGADGTMSWFDMKTVAPGWQDDEPSWERFQRIAKEFPDNAVLAVDREWSGAAISGQEIKARWTFVTRTQEVERKAALLTDAERGPVRLLLCSSGAWRQDALEDFADFYRTGAFREDDWARNALSKYMADEGITLDRSLAGFSYIERAHDEVIHRRFTKDVRGPRPGGPTQSVGTAREGGPPGADR